MIYSFKALPKPTLIILNFSMAKGGSERISVYLSNYFAEMGWKVVLLTFDSTLCWALNPQVKFDCIGPYVNIIVATYRLFKYVSSHPGAVVIANCWPLSFISMVVSIMLGSNVRSMPVEHFSIQGSLQSMRTIKKILFIKTLRYTYKFSPFGIAISSELFADLLSIGVPSSKLCLVNNPVAPSLLPALDRSNLPPLFEHALSRFKDVIFMVGSLSERKDYDLALLAFAHACLDRKSDICLCIAGDGSCRTRIEDQINSLNLEDSVFLLGPVCDPLSLYSYASVFLLTSKYEGLPSVLIEALSQGVTVVSVDCPTGPREVLGKSYPYLVKERSASMLGEALKVALDFPISKEHAIDLSSRYRITDRCRDYFDLATKLVNA